MDMSLRSGHNGADDPEWEDAIRGGEAMEPHANFNAAMMWLFAKPVDAARPRLRSRLGNGPQGVDPQV